LRRVSAGEIVATTVTRKREEVDRGRFDAKADFGRSQPNGLDAAALGRSLTPCEVTANGVHAADSDVRDRKAADWTLESAIPLLGRAAHGPVDHLVGGPDACTAVQDAVREHHFDEIIISTLPTQTSKWLRRDLVRRVEALGVPVTAIVPRQKSIRDTVEDSDDVTRAMIGGG
jgi:hypothetical protein